MWLFLLRQSLAVYIVSIHGSKQERYLANRTCVFIYQCPIIPIYSKIGKFSSKILCSVSLNNYFSRISSQLPCFGVFLFFFNLVDILP